MVAKKRKREERKYKFQKGEKNPANRRAAAERHSFSRTAFDVPAEMSLFKIKDDKQKRISIVPFEVKDNPNGDPGYMHYERTFFVHRNVGADNVVVVCPEKEKTATWTGAKYGKCPICEYRRKLEKKGDANWEDIKALRPQERQLFIVLDHNDEEKGLQLWEQAWYSFGRLLDKEIQDADDDDNYDCFYFIDDTGSQLRLSVQEGVYNKRPTFNVISINFKTRKDELDEELVEGAPCLDDLIIVKDYDELKKLFLETDEEEEEDEDEDAPKAKKTKAKKTVEPEDEDEDEEDEEEEPAPKKGKKGKGKKAVEPEEEEEEEEDEVWADEEDTPWDDDEDDEEEEKPKPKKGKGKGKSKKTVEPEEEEEEDEEEEPAPKKGKKGKGKKIKDEDEEEDPWVDEDAEEFEADEEESDTPETPEYEDFLKMKKAQVLQLIDDLGVDIDPDDYSKFSELKDAVAEQLYDIE